MCFIHYFCCIILITHEVVAQVFTNVLPLNRLNLSQMKVMYFFELMCIVHNGPLPALRMEEQVTQEAALKLREQLLSHEKELVRSQNEWLSRSLSSHFLSYLLSFLSSFLSYFFSFLSYLLSFLSYFSPFSLISPLSLLFFSFFSLIFSHFSLFHTIFLSTRELEDKSEQLLRVKKEKATVLADLEAKLASREREVHSIR